MEEPWQAKWEIPAVICAAPADAVRGVEFHSFAYLVSWVLMSDAAGNFVRFVRCTSGAEPAPIFLEI